MSQIISVSTSLSGYKDELRLLVSGVLCVGITEPYPFFNVLLHRVINNHIDIVPSKRFLNERHLKEIAICFDWDSKK